MASSKKQGMRQRGKLARATKHVDKRNIKAMANPLRNQILAILHERRASKTELAKELGFEWGEVSYEIEALEDAKLVEKVAEKKKRGAMEIFYRATARAYIDPEEWLQVAGPIKGKLRASLLRNLTVDAATAISEDTYDSLVGAHMSWTPMIVDEQGWEELTAIMLCTLEEVVELQESSASRLEARDAEGISCTVSMLGYTSAIEERKVGPPTDAKQLVDLVKHEDVKAERVTKKKARAKKAKALGKKQAGKAAPKSRRKGIGK
jgi:DNA-binding transcriptional ArsR family regulator